jgi:hypothetical protein
VTGMTENQKSGAISLKAFYDLVKQQANRGDPVEEVWQELRKEFWEKVDQLTQSIDDAPGFYVWGYYGKRSYWHSVYLGKAGFGQNTRPGQATLRSRIREELQEEREFAWRSIYSDQELLAIRRYAFRNRTAYIRKKASYERYWMRAMEKHPATHIVWVTAASVSSEKVRHVEADLIEALNPRANRIRPVPPDIVQAEATTMFQGIRMAIHAARATKFTAPSVATAAVQSIKDDFLALSKQDRIEIERWFALDGATE